MDLQQRFVAGDLEAFEQLFRDHQRQVYAWIMRIVRNSATAEDLTVETFWRIYRSRLLFRPDGSFSAWSHRIATNVALDHLRKARLETTLPDDLLAPVAPDPAVSRETRDRIRSAFVNLPPKYRLVATLALIEEAPYEKIAATAGITISLVKVRVFRATRMLRKQLRALATEIGARS
ncbi:MAG TPA: RNA polymerase sigma factor [Candidatus Sulfotelmatobacter sp.]|nr:RNA polymerase sigma factor [Candidatus Sulfotelmatobacter sp.]